jgi:flagellar hook-associated protein 2
MSTGAIGSSLIAAAGAGSKDFEVETTAVGLADAETMVARGRIEEKSEASTLELSSFGTLRSALDGFKANITTLQSLSSLQKRYVGSSDTKVLTAIATQSAKEGSYSVEVSQLAKAQSSYSSSFSSLTDSVGTGTLSFQFGTSTKAVSGAATAIASGKTDSDGIVVTVAGTALTISDDQDLSTASGVDSFIAAVKTAINADATLSAAGITAIVNDSSTAGADTITISDQEGDVFSITVAAPAGGSAAATDSEVAAALGISSGVAAVDKLVLNPKRTSGTVVIDSTNNSLMGLRDAVNAAKIGVQAAIVNDGSGYRMTFSSITGAVNSIQTTVTGDSDSNNSDSLGLSRFVYNDTTKNMTQSVSAQDAKLKVNGLSVTSASNTVTDVVEGVTLGLVAADAGKSKTISVINDKSGLKTAVENFVLDFNALKDITASLGAFDSTTGESAGLQGDPTLRALVGEVRSLISTPVASLSGNYSALSTIGVSLSKNNDGKLALDVKKLDAVLKDNFDAVGKLFAATASSSDAQVSFEGHTKDTKAGAYAVNVTQVATQGKLDSGTTVGASSGGSVTVGSGNDTFTIKVDGITSGTVALTQRVYSSKSDLASEIQSQINGDTVLTASSVKVIVSYDSVSNKFSITSDRYGSASMVEMLTVESAGSGAGQSGEIGLATGGSVTAGADVAGTINGEAALGTGQYLTSSTGNANGLKLLISAGTTGSRGTATMTRGYADQLISTIDKYVDKKTGLLKVREDAISNRLKSFTEDSAKLDTRYETLLSRYRRQFSTLNALLGSLDMQSEWMKTSFEGLSGNN